MNMFKRARKQYKSIISYYSFSHRVPQMYGVNDLLIVRILVVLLCPTELDKYLVRVGYTLNSTRESTAVLSTDI